MSPQLIAVRHAPVAVTGLCYGQADVAVTLAPDEAAQAIMNRIDRDDRGGSVARVWSSPARRCAEPARVLAWSQGVPLLIDERLAELGFGEWETRPWSEIEATDGAGLRTWMEAWETAAPPGGETVGQLERRVREWLAALDRNESHLMIGHAGPIRALSVIIGGLRWQAAMGLAINPLEPVSFPLTQ
jgi:alpha-ribazole phosphatase